MSQKLPVSNFNWIKSTSQFNEDFIKNYNEGNDKGYSLEVHVHYTKKLHELHNDLPFLPETQKTEEVEKLFVSLQEKTGYFIHIGNLKQALNHGLVLKKVHIVIKSNQTAWLKPYIDIKNILKSDFGKGLFKMMNNAVFGKNYGKCEKAHIRDIKAVTTERRSDCLVSVANYYPTKFFTEYLLIIEMIKTRTLMNKPVYLGLSILDLSKILICEFWVDYVEPKYGEKLRFCYLILQIIN